MRNFIVQAYTNYRGLFGWISWFSYLTTVFLRPVIMVITYLILGRFAGSPEVIQHYAIGIAVYSMPVIVLPGIAQCYTYDRSGGTLAFFYVTPASRLISYLSRPLLHYPNALFSFTATLFAAWVTVGLNLAPVNWTGFVISVLVTAASVTALGQFLGTFAIIFRDWTNVQAIATGLLLVLTGVIIPITLFPTGIRIFLWLLPMTNGLVAVQQTFAGGALSSVINYIIFEALIALGYTVLGYMGFRLFEKAAKKRGTLDLESL
jgi:ABC-type polysaccharide/polyol phosphate export permease